jgi:hypothetical protein
MQKINAILLGIGLFSLVVGLGHKAFQKPPEQIAEEECAEFLNTSNALGINAQTTIYIEGVPYDCN